MKSYMIRVNEEYLNWQGIPADKTYAHVFSSADDANAVAAAIDGAEVVIVNAPPSSNVSLQQGTYFEHHRRF